MDAQPTGADQRDDMAERYARRAGLAHRYSLMRPEVLHAWQERQRAMLRLFALQGWQDVSTVRAVEVGCGGGANLLELLRLGCMPAQLTGIEMLPDRLAQARRTLPEAVRLIDGDAADAAIEPGSADLVLQSTVFTSLLQQASRRRLADAMWRWVAPGGGVLWYDFIVDNPRNRDVRGVPLAELRALFPQGQLQARRVTLAPPLARTLARVHPGLLPLANALPLLRTHVLAWIAKPL